MVKTKQLKKQLADSGKPFKPDLISKIHNSWNLGSGLNQKA